MSGRGLRPGFGMWDDKHRLRLTPGDGITRNLADCDRAFGFIDDGRTDREKVA